VRQFQANEEAIRIATTKKATDEEEREGIGSMPIHDTSRQGRIG